MKKKLPLMKAGDRIGKKCSLQLPDLPAYTVPEDKQLDEIVDETAYYSAFNRMLAAVSKLILTAALMALYIIAVLKLRGLPAFITVGLDDTAIYQLELLFKGALLALTLPMIFSIFGCFSEMFKASRFMKALKKGKKEVYKLEITGKKNPFRSKKSCYIFIGGVMAKIFADEYPKLINGDIVCVLILEHKGKKYFCNIGNSFYELLKIKDEPREVRQQKIMEAMKKRAEKKEQ